MFEALRTTTFLGLLAAGVPAFVSAQAHRPRCSSPRATDWPQTGQQTGQPAEGAQPAATSGQETGSPHPAMLDAQHRPITAGGFVKSGPIVFEDDSEKAGLTHWTHKMGTPEKSYIVETKGSGMGLIDYDNNGGWIIYVVNGRRSTRWTARRRRRMRRSSTTTTTERLPMWRPRPE